MTEQPKSECKCIDKPELETLSYKPVKSSRTTEENLTPIIEPKTKGKNSKIACQPLERLLCHQTMTGRECIGCSIDAAGKCPLTDDKPEQPNTEHEPPNSNVMILEQAEGATKVVLELLKQLEPKTTEQQTEKESSIWTLDGWLTHNLKHLSGSFG